MQRKRHPETAKFGAIVKQANIKAEH